MLSMWYFLFSFSHVIVCKFYEFSIVFSVRWSFKSCLILVFHNDCKPFRLTSICKFYYHSIHIHWGMFHLFHLLEWGLSAVLFSSLPLKPVKNCFFHSCDAWFFSGLGIGLSEKLQLLSKKTLLSFFVSHRELRNVKPCGWSLSWQPCFFPLPVVL